MLIVGDSGRAVMLLSSFSWLLLPASLVCRKRQWLTIPAPSGQRECRQRTHVVGSTSEAGWRQAGKAAQRAVGQQQHAHMGEWDGRQVGQIGADLWSRQSRAAEGFHGLTSTRVHAV